MKLLLDGFYYLDCLCESVLPKFKHSLNAMTLHTLINRYIVTIVRTFI